MTKEKKDNSVPSATGMLRLTSDGTQVYDNLPEDSRHYFFDILLKELSSAVPVNLSRLNIERTHLDNSLGVKQHLIFINIEETKDLSENGVESIFRIIDIMINHKDQTPIGTGQVTCYLDESYGFIHCLYICVSIFLRIEL